MTEGNAAIGVENQPGSLSVRWVVFFTGLGAAEDYQPAASDGETPALVKEVTDLCVALHPHSDIRLFPQDSGVLLFWRAKATKDWVITRVTTAPNPQGLRTALEYCSMVFTDADLRRLEYDPFTVISAGISERVRKQFLEGRTTPVTMASAGPGATAASAGAKQGTSTDIPGLGNDGLASVENFAALRAYCAQRSQPPVTFTTWWSSAGPLPVGYFDVVLRAAPSAVLTLREAGDAVAALAADVKLTLPKVPPGDPVGAELARNILANADAAKRAVDDASTRINTEGPDPFRDRMVGASRLTAQTASDIMSLVQRLGLATDGTEAARLMEISERSETLAGDLPKVRHPNPFAFRAAPPTTVGTASTAPRATSGTTKYLVPAAAVVLLLGAWYIFSRNGSAETRPATTTGAATGTSADRVGGVTATNPVVPATPKAVNPIVAALTQAAPAVLAPAKKMAQTNARDSAADPAADALGDRGVEKITVAAIESAYKEALPADQYAAAFGPAHRPVWTYARLAQLLPTVAPAVHEAATVGVVQGQESRKLKAAASSTAQARAETEAAKAETARTQAAAASEQAKRETRSARKDSTPEPTRRHHTETAEASPPPRRTTHREASSGSATPTAHHKAPISGSDTGSAAQTGL